MRVHARPAPILRHWYKCDLEFDIDLGTDRVTVSSSRFTTIIADFNGNSLLLLVAAFRKQATLWELDRR